ncbi:transmembrane protein 107 [Galendromus occidentalis]|uniref:Transmembrane protein 107 n=1 Tax=Galendromus occidentalis TaxID=34638 RepID=A0AAJ7L559_9ACAR|nr:transmembrane protein 107 [Galendromus occidentalis]
MGSHSGFEVPRFVVLLGHFVLLIVLLWDVEVVAKSSLPWSQRDDHSRVESVQTQITAGLATSTTLVAIELTCFMIGASLFFPTQCLSSAVVHSISFVSLAFFMADTFHVKYFWILFVLTALSCMAEVTILFGALILNKPL